MKSQFDFKIFKANIDILLKSANNVIEGIGEIHFRNQEYPNEQIEAMEEIFVDELKIFKEDELKYILSAIELKIIFALDFLKLNHLLERFEVDIKKFKDPTDINYKSFIGIWYSPKLICLKNYINSILSASDIRSTQYEIEKLALLEQILKGTNKLIFDNGINPKNENEVQKEVHKVLVHVFPDTLREFSIPKIVKSYKPDFGIKSLKCAIEYKFIDSESEAKKFCGEIFEDVHAYEGYEDWKIFYAVIYMTDAFFTQDQIEYEFKICGIPENWKPIVIYGKGERKKKTTKK